MNPVHVLLIVLALALFEAPWSPVNAPTAPVGARSSSPMSVSAFVVGAPNFTQGAR